MEGKLEAESKPMTEGLIIFCPVNSEQKLPFLRSFKGSLLNKSKSREGGKRGRRRGRGKKGKLLGAITGPQARILH